MRVPRPRIPPTTAEITNRIRAITATSLAISKENLAMPPKPSTAATIATTRKITVQRSMGALSC